MTAHGDEFKLYKERRAKRLLYRRLWLITLTALLLLALVAILFSFYFTLKEVTVEGTDRYTVEEISQEAGISMGDNLLLIREKEIESKLKASFPFIKAVKVEKDFPSAVKLIVTEEYTVFSYEMLGEYFLFNRDLHLMGKFDSREGLLEERKSIFVAMPLPKSCIVPQYIQFHDDCSYVLGLISLISDSPLISEITKIDMTDKFFIKMEFGQNISVKFGDMAMAEKKLISLYELIGNQSEFLSGTVDMTDYPNCFYALTQK